VRGIAVGDHIIFSFTGHCDRCRYCASGRSVLCNGYAAAPQGTLLDGTTRMSVKGRGVRQMARIG
jgi:Zn-dependent alcohol dehydrogenase